MRQKLKFLFKIKNKRVDPLTDEAVLLKKACSDIESWFDYFSENINRAHSDVKFALESQWDEDVKRRRLNEGKPTFELNQLYAQVSAIIGEQRQNTPNILVHPVSADAN